MNLKQKNKRSKKKDSINWGILFFEVIGWIVAAGMLLGIYNSNKTISVILESKPIHQLTADTTGIVRIEGHVTSENVNTEQGILRHSYALIQKEVFKWRCSRSCDYKLEQGAAPIVSGSISVNGIEVKADQYTFYKDWLPLDNGTIEPDQLYRIYEGGTSRPLLVEEHESTAYGYRTVSSGEWITLVGNAVNGRVEAFSILKNEGPTVLIGINIEQMVAKEREARTLYIIVAILAMLILSPVMIRRLRRRYVIKKKV